MEYDVDTADLDAETAKIAALKAKRIEVARRAQREREKEAAKILIDSTPTKKAVKNHETPLPERPKQPVFQPKPEAKVQELPSVPSKPAPSSMASSLAALRKYASGSSMPKAEVARSSSFTTRPEAGPSRKRPTSEDEDELEVEPPPRQDDLTVMQNLVPGPKEFGRDPEGENEWLHLEPNSRIRLQKRILPHATLQEHLYGRYYLSPSQLYSVIRLSRDGATYDVPVEGDWITIAVVAERSDIRVSGAKEEIHSDDDEEDETGNKKVKQGDKPKDKETRSKEQWKKRRGPRKYINLRMCSLPPKRPGTSESSGGDALLQLLLFESDATVHSVADGEKKYRGGSGGAYEKWCNLTAGCVVAILNPRVLRPLKSGPHAPHPLTLPLALNPTSADSVILIGHARDLGQCNATQKDGNRCKTWIDMRQSPVCEYHIHQTIQRGRNSRAEFTASTSGFGLASRPVGGKGGKDEYDPKRKFGLLPAGPMAAPRSQDNGGGGVTYVVGGNPVNMRRTDGGLRSFGDEKLSEKLGRSRAERKKRKLEAEQADQVLNDLLGKDGGGGMTTGGKYLAQVEKANAARVAESDKAKGKDKGKGKADQKDKGKEGEDVDPKRVFSAGAIRKIGFDPTARRGERDGEETQKRLDAIASLKEVTDRPLKLSRPKDLSRSNVRAPPGTESTVSDEVTPDYHLDFIDLD